MVDAAFLKRANTLDMVVTVLWKANTAEGTIWGQHSVHLEDLGVPVTVPQYPLGLTAAQEEKPPIRIIPEHPPSPASSLLPPPERLKDLVKVAGRFPSRAEHDFHANR